MKLKRDQTALIKDLEAQIDALVGYSPQCTHWKLEYHVRENLINDTIASDETPEEIKHKIWRIQQSLIDLREGNKRDQPYLEALQEQDDKREILIDHGKSESVFLNGKRDFVGYSDLYL